jgi:hydroxymethylpyrimidine pyrophosphatase-like HAD family hydrolase
MTARFSAKLDSLPSTVGLCGDQNVSDLASAILCGGDRPTVLIGSGGSAISANFFSLCRSTFSFSRSAIETPMQFVSGMSGLQGNDVWLFTAGAENADVMAAVQSAYRRGAAKIYMITRNSDGRAVRYLKELGGDIFSVPVSEEKDGFLATHSLMATVATLLLAFDSITEVPSGGKIIDRFVAEISSELEADVRNQYLEAFSSLRNDDTLLVLSEPQLSSISTLIDTSVWEAAICNVQSTDFRNFAHGRHTWLQHRPNRTFVLALTGQDLPSIHESILSLIPAGVRRTQVNFGNCGRFENAVGLVRGLIMIEAMGSAVKIDPGRPGVGIFGRNIYEDEALLSASRSIVSAVRHKYAFFQKQDTVGNSLALLSEFHRKRLTSLETQVFGGIVLDYDGTIVSTDDRRKPPVESIRSQLIRLHDLGVKVAIATGRGGSAGDQLRQVFDLGAHQEILMGYYNGAYLQTLDVDIKVDRPNPNEDIDAAIAWLDDNPQFFKRYESPKRGLQVTIQKADLVSPKLFFEAVSAIPLVTSNCLQLNGSAHSFDIVVSGTSKLDVVKAVGLKIKPGSAVLCLGDSGSIIGNDHDLLSHPCGISVDAVCGGPDGSWSVYGYEKSGPDALLAILSSLIPVTGGGVQFSAEALPLDR